VGVTGVPLGFDAVLQRLGGGGAGDDDVGGGSGAGDWFRVCSASAIRPTSYSRAIMVLRSSFSSSSSMVSVILLIFLP
jgi:hypothetical protein